MSTMKTVASSPSSSHSLPGSNSTASKRTRPMRSSSQLTASDSPAAKNRMLRWPPGANLALPSMWRRPSLCWQTSRRVMTLKSRVAPSSMVAATSASPGKLTTSVSPGSSSWRPTPMSSMRPGPSSSARLRSTPGKWENGPSWAIEARLRRHSKLCRVAPGGSTAISVVLPPPFFHGEGVSEANGIRVLMDSLPQLGQRRQIAARNGVLFGMPARAHDPAPAHQHVPHQIIVPCKDQQAQYLAGARPGQVRLFAVEHQQVGAPPHCQGSHRAPAGLGAAEERLLPQEVAHVFLA